MMYLSFEILHFNKFFVFLRFIKVLVYLNLDDANDPKGLVRL